MTERNKSENEISLYVGRVMLRTLMNRAADPLNSKINITVKSRVHLPNIFHPDLSAHEPISLSNILLVTSCVQKFPDLLSPDVDAYLPMVIL